MRLDINRSPLIGFEGEERNDHVWTGDLGALGVGQSRTLRAIVDPGNYGGPSSGEMTFE